MADTTSNFGLRRPAGADLVDVALDIAGNMTLIDAHLHPSAYAALVHLHDSNYAALVHSHGSVTLPWFSVKDAPFSASGDGTTDDTVAIQAALDAVPSTGGTVFFPAGRYKVSSTLKVEEDNTTLFGVGPGDESGQTQVGIGSSIQAATGLTGSIIRVQRVADDRPVLGVVIRDLTVDGNSIGSGVEGIHFRSNRGFIQNVNVFDCTGNGIQIEGYSGWATYDTRVIGALVGRCDAAGIYTVTRGEDLHLTNCILFANQDGLRVQGASEQVTACHFYDNTRYGVFFDAGGTRSKLIGCKIEGNDAGGVRLETTSGSGMSDIQIIGCGFADNFAAVTNTIDDIYIGGDSATGCSRTMIVGNSFSNKGGGGASVKGKYAINLVNNAAQSTFISGNVFGRASASLHYGTAYVLDSGNTSQYLKTYTRANQGVADACAAFDGRGTGVITAAATSVVITHGLDLTPVVSGISITPTNTTTNDTVRWWVDTITATQFTVNVGAAPGASTFTFAWRALG